LLAELELLELLRHDPHWDEPRVLLMSAHPGQAGIAGAVRDGSVAAFLAKPFDVDQLVVEVRRAVAARSDGAGVASIAPRSKWTFLSDFVSRSWVQKSARYPPGTRVGQSRWSQ